MNAFGLACDTRVEQRMMQIQFRDDHALSVGHLNPAPECLAPETARPIHVLSGYEATCDLLDFLARIEGRIR